MELTEELDATSQKLRLFVRDTRETTAWQGLTNVIDAYDPINAYAQGYWAFNQSLINIQMMFAKVRYPSVLSVWSKIDPNSPYHLANPVQTLIEFLYTAPS